MDKLLRLGGSAYSTDSEEYFIPYVFTDWPSGLDPFDHLAVTATRVNVRDKPDLEDSQVLGQFNFDIVKVDYNKSYPPFDEPEIEGVEYIGSKLWYYVESLDGQLKGFVYWDLVWSPIGYRAGFRKQDGVWKIRFLLSGD